jgi:hypothetical protein
VCTLSLDDQASGDPTDKIVRRKPMAVAFGKSCQKGPVASEVSLFDGHRPEFSISQVEQLAVALLQI